MNTLFARTWLIALTLQVFYSADATAGTDRNTGAPADLTLTRTNDWSIEHPASFEISRHEADTPVVVYLEFQGAAIPGRAAAGSPLGIFDPPETDYLVSSNVERYEDTRIGRVVLDKGERTVRFTCMPVFSIGPRTEHRTMRVAIVPTEQATQYLKAIELARAALPKVTTKIVRQADSDGHPLIVRLSRDTAGTDPVAIEVTVNTKSAEQCFLPSSNMRYNRVTIPPGTVSIEVTFTPCNPPSALPADPVTISTKVVPRRPDVLLTPQQPQSRPTER